MVRNLREAVPCRTVLLVVLALALALTVMATAGAGVDSSPPGSSVAVTTAPSGKVGVADAVCVRRGPDGPEPCEPGKLN